MTALRVPGQPSRRDRTTRELVLAATGAACRPSEEPRVGELVAAASPLAVERLPALAAAHRVEGCVHAVLDHVGGVDPRVLDRLAAGRRLATTRHLIVRDVLARLDAVLTGAGIPWLVLKGPAVSSSLYCEPGMRLYSDLDVLVSPRRFGEAVQAMEDAGFRNPVTLWSPQLFFRSGAIAFESGDVGDLSIDLHWHVLYKHQDRRWLRIDPDELFERRRTIDIGGVACATFDEVDTLFHLALHSAAEGCHRLVWLKDIERAVAVGQPDLDELVRRSRRAGCAPAIGIALARARWALGAAVPDEIVTALAGRVWPRIVRAVVAFDDLGSTSRRSSPGTVLTRHTRMSLPRTATRAARRLGDRRTERSFDRVLQQGFDPDRCTPDELSRNAADRAAYLALVRKWGVQPT